MHKTTHPVEIKADNIYVLAENSFVTIYNGVFEIWERKETGIRNHAIHMFFQSLASEFNEKAIGIVLSGNGNDRLAGTTAIKNHGGPVLIQNPEIVKYPGMPSSNLINAHPDGILEPGKIADYLISYINKFDRAIS